MQLCLADVFRGRGGWDIEQAIKHAQGFGPTMIMVKYTS